MDYPSHFPPISKTSVRDMTQTQINEEIQSIKYTLNYINEGHGARSIKNIELQGKYTNELMERLNKLQSRNIEPSEVSSPIKYENSEALMLENGPTQLTGISRLNPSERQLKRTNELRRRVMRRKAEEAKGTAIGGGWRKSKRKSKRKSRKSKRKSRRR